MSDPHDDSPDERVDHLILEYLEEVDAGREPDRRALIARHPDLAEELSAFFADQDRVAQMARPTVAETTDPISTTTACDDVPTTVGGYRLLRLLGAGGMGRVYEAEGAGGQRVAVKLLSPALADSPTTLERFRQEGRLASRIAHPRCVFVHTADEDGGRPFIVMELMSGATLKDLVDGAGPLPPADAIARILDVIEGLEEAHHAGILHRDVKPANCYLDADGRVKVGDFGLSRSLAVASHLTRTGGFVGTPLFASPEQLKGERLDARTDVYSVAATLYYLLTGQAPFQHADGATVIARVVSEPVTPPRRLRPDIPRALEEVVLRGLERQRERRYPSLAAMREALLPLLPGQMSIAGLGLRVGAYLIDALPFMVLGEIVGVLSIQRELTIRPVTMLLLTAPYFVYIWLADGLWGQSVGKWLLRLRVTRARGSERPGLVRGLLRAAVFVATGGLVANLILYPFLDESQPLRWAPWSLVGGVLSMALRFITMRRRNGYRGLHEVLSDTRVVQLPISSRPGWPICESLARRDRLAELVSPPAGAAGVPAQVGVFAIRGLLRREGAQMLLLGEDTMLGRRVCLRWRPPKAESLPAARRDLTRGARLRWLSAGVEADGRWDAFVAPEGATLADTVAATGPLDWAATRLVVESLTEELHAAAADGTMPQWLTPEQVWLDANGRVQLLDWPVADSVTIAANHADGTADERSLELLRQVAALALEGGTPSPELSTQLRAVVPLHARRILARLIGEPDRYHRLDELRASLTGTRTRPTAVTPALRAFQLAISFCFVAVGAMAMIGWSRNAGIAQSLILDRTILHEQVLDEILVNAELSQPLLSKLPTDDPLRTVPQEQCRLVAELRARQARELEERMASLGMIQYAVQTIPALHMRTNFGGSDEPLQIALRPGPDYAVDVVRLRLPEAEHEVVQRGDLLQAAARARGDNADEVLSERYAPLVGMALVTLLFVPLLLAGGAALFRGGLSMQLTGLALVRSDGHDAGRLRCVWRVAVVWLPVVAVLLPIVWVDLHRPDLLWLCPILQGLSVLLLLTPAALALRYPRRSLPDWLAGTYLVPR
jgi:hypothetical protein